MVLRLHVRSRNLNKAKNTLPLFERSEIGQEKIYYYTVSTLLFFFAKQLHAKPKDASGEAACREKRGRKPEKKK